VIGFCEHVSELADSSIKYWEFVEWLSHWWLLKKRSEVKDI
jgi:hypothetical protein